jgi:hypothetical protein
MGRKSRVIHDIEINGQSFFTIHAETDEGAAWLWDNTDIPAGQRTAPCDDQNYAQDIADAAHDDGLAVSVNGRRYLGDNKVA